MGATLPVLKNEIRDFFFARLGTGRTSQNRRATTRLRMDTIVEFIGVENVACYIFGFIFLDLYFIYLSLAVCCYNNESYVFYFLYIYHYLYVVITTKSNMRRGLCDICFDVWVLYCTYTPLLVVL